MTKYTTRHGRKVIQTKLFAFPVQVKNKKNRRNSSKVIKKAGKKAVKKSVKKKVPKLKFKKIKYKTKITKTKRIRFPQVIRGRVSARQEWSCGICKELLGECIIIDHKVPLCFGGSNDISNLQALCPECDKFKTGWLDYKILKNLSNEKSITPSQVSELQQEYFNKIMGGNTIKKNNQLILSKENIQQCNGKTMQIDFNGIKITIQA